MARKGKKAKTVSVWRRLLVVLFRPWALFERSAFWNMLLDHYCVNNFERNHCEGNVGRSSEAVDVYRVEFILFTLLIVFVLQPGILSTWISTPLLFLWLMSRRMRAAIKDTFGGVQIAFDTGGKVFGFFTFGSAINYFFSCLIATIIEWSETVLLTSGRV